MPTPSPIIAANWGAKLGSGAKLATSARMAKADPRPKSAEPTGRPIATIEPKATTRITIAAMRPNYSELKLPCSTLATTRPPGSTTRPWLLAATVTAINALMSLVFSVAAGFDHWTVDPAIVPSFEIEPGRVKGESTLTTSGTR